MMSPMPNDRDCFATPRLSLNDQVHKVARNDDTLTKQLFTLKLSNTILQSPLDSMR